VYGEVLYYPSRAKRGVSLEICIGVVAKWRDVTRPAICQFSSPTNGAKDLKIGMHIPHIEGSKVTIQIFDILSRN